MPVLDTAHAKILLVDDEPINLELFEVMLSKLGFQVSMAANGEQALELLAEVEPDLIILDNLMPGISGWEVTRRIKHDAAYAAFRHVPIIMFSALDGIEDRIEGLELGVDDYIAKPFRFSEVLARIRAVLHRHELTRQLARREHRLGIIEALNESLVFFSQHVKRPLQEQVERATQLRRQGDVTELRAFAAVVQQQAQNFLTTLTELEREITDVRDQGQRLKEGDLGLEELQALIHERLSGRT